MPDCPAEITISYRISTRGDTVKPRSLPVKGQPYMVTLYVFYVKGRTEGYDPCFVISKTDRTQDHVLMSHSGNIGLFSMSAMERGLVEAKRILQWMEATPFPTLLEEVKCL